MIDVHELLKHLKTFVPAEHTEHHALVVEAIAQTAPVEVGVFPQVLEATRDEVDQRIVQWRKVRERRLEADRQSRVLKTAEDLLNSFVIECFRQQKLEGQIIEGRVTGLGTKQQPTVTDKEALIEHIKTTGELELLQFRLSAGAVDERHANDVEVPGVEYVDVYSLYDRKV